MQMLGILHWFLFHYFDFLFWLGDNVPSRREVAWAIHIRDFNGTVASVMVGYAATGALGAVAASHGYTRERTRQLLLKGCMEARWATRKAAK